MGDIFERIKRQYDAWKLEKKYIRRRRSVMMSKSRFPVLSFAYGIFLSWDMQMQFCFHDLDANCFVIDTFYRYDNGEYVPCTQPLSPGASTGANPLTIKHRKSWIWE